MSENTVDSANITDSNSAGEAAQPFVFDNSTPTWHLTKLAQYCALIPYVAEGDKDATGDWSQVLFGNDDGAPREQLIAHLVELYNHPEKADGKLPPQQALLLAWLRQLETPRKLLNMLPALHKQLYYRDYLGLKPADPEPDSVMLALTLEDEVEVVVLPANTLFDAGEDTDGNPLHYALKDPLPVNQGVLTDIFEVYPPKGKIFHLLALPEKPFPPEGYWLFKNESKIPATTEYCYLSHPAFWLSSGNRVVTLGMQDLAANEKVSAELYQDGKWVPIKSMAVSTNKLTLTFDSAHPPLIAPIHDETDKTIPPSIHPLMRFWTTGKLLKEFVNVTVDVTNATVLISNNEGVITPNNIFKPFGETGNSGYGINIISPDWVRRGEKIDIKFMPFWNKLPDDSLQNLYKSYKSSPVDDEDFKASCFVISQEVNKSDVTELNLFNSIKDGKVDAVKTHSITITKPKAVDVADSDNPTDWPWWVRFELGQQDFMHSLYTDNLLKSQQFIISPNGVEYEIPQYTIKPAEGNYLKADYKPQTVVPIAPLKHKFDTIVLDDTSKPLELKPPYTPEWSNLKIDFSYALEPLPIAQSVSTLNGFSDNATHIIELLSTLYLGFSNLKPLAEISLYWKLRAPVSFKTTWEYLASTNDKADKWQRITNYTDETEQLSKSGLWSSVLPADASSEFSNTLNKDKKWLRVSFGKLDLAPLVNPTSQTEIKKTDEDHPQLLGLYANAGIAVLQNTALINDQHFSQPLPLNTVSALVENIPGIATVVQPLPSFNGKARETDDKFNIRVADRLRHRNRALSWKDIHTLLLAKYPEIQALKIGTTTRNLKKLVCMPMASKADNDNRLQPIFNDARLKEMAEYISSIGSIWLKLKIVNPTYTEVFYKFEAHYKKGVMKDVGIKRVTAAVQSKFIPWAKGDSKTTLELGNTLNYYDLMALIEEQDDVEQLISLEFCDKDGKPLDPKLIEVIAKPDEVLLLTHDPKTD